MIGVKMKFVARLLCVTIIMLLVSPFCGTASAQISDAERQMFKTVYNVTNGIFLTEELTSLILVEKLWRKLDRSDRAHIRELRYYQMTNIVAYLNALGRNHTHIVHYAHMGDFLGILGSFNCEREDLPFVRYVADFIGDYYQHVKPKSPREYYRTDQENGFRDLNKIKILRYLRPLTTRYETFLRPEEVMSFRHDIITRARFRSTTVVEMWGKEFFR